MQFLELRHLSRVQWQSLHALYRDPELAALNAAEPTRMPLWLFRLLLLAEQGRERVSFGVTLPTGELIGNAELYDFAPAHPEVATRATLGVMLAPPYWGHGYGRDTLYALLGWAFGVHKDGPDTPLERVRLTTLAHNNRALSAFLRAGFEEKGRFSRGRYPEVNMEVLRGVWLEEFQPQMSSGAAAARVAHDPQGDASP
ncbi:GNAT family N-acetyltransferase [Deinococcus radiophilus]|uniref:GNAT family N-acetyltransferase n=1 Tax=Deinococcus radiophilus TaxID=32062 RepID=UPI00360A5757